MKLILFISAIFLDLVLLIAFELSELKIKRILFIPLTCVHCIICYFTYITREKTPFNIIVKTFFRLFKFLFVFLFIYTLQKVVYLKYPDSVYTGAGLVMLIDLIRAFLYEIVSHGFKSRITNGIFDDILELEPFFWLIKHPNRSTEQLNYEEFYSMGRPIKVDHDYLFDLWNDESVRNDKSLAVYTTEDISLRPEAEEISNEARLYNKRALINRNQRNPYGSPYKKKREVNESIENEVDTIVKPETYSFNTTNTDDTFDVPNSEVNSINNRDIESINNRDIESINNRDIESINNRDIESINNRDIESINNTNPQDQRLYNCDSDEIVSDDEQEEEEILNEFQKKDHEANLWISINEEVRKAQHTQPKTGRITKKSLKHHFKEKSEIVFRILTFNRTEELNYTVFRDNIRQINNERDNLFTAIECNNNLLSKIYYTLITIEGLIIYWLISSWLDIQPLLVKLCLPIFILPAFPSIKVMIESFLFIVYSHPYDPGDRIHLDGENYIVRDITLLTTTLIRWDGMRCYIANVLIKDKSVTNIRRSNAQMWTIDLLIDARTSERKMEELQGILNRLVEEDKSYKSINMHTEEIIDSAYIKLNLLVKHKYNFQSGFLMWNNHTKFLRILSASLAIIGIKYLPMKQNIDLIET